ncbi:MAG: hypothetical protein K0S65_344 [Labilithrix sp.]|nr:hypothetical protein [Labilithrix sp.]
MISRRDHHRRLTELGSEVASSLDQARVKSAAAARVREKLVAREVPRLRAAWRAEPVSPGVRFGIAAGLTLAATIALTTFFAWPVRQPAAQRLPSAHPIATEAENLSFVVGQGKAEARGTPGAFIAAPAMAEMPITFSDGSQLRLSPTAKVRVAEVARVGARVLVESGTVHVSVVHREETRWAVEAGPFEVRVTGTSFDVVYDPASSGLVVRMTEGTVFVRGCDLLGDEGRRLTTGEQLRVSCRDRSMSVSSTDAVPIDALTASAAPSAAPAPAAVRSPNAPALAVASADHPKATGAEAQSVVTLARQGAHAEALAAAETHGFGATCDALSGPELLLLADAGRYAGRFDRATEALEATRRRFAGSDAAGTAAFELGRIAMDVRHELGTAGDHFETYLRERPSGSFAREALGRAIEARSRAGDSARAERLAVRYLATYPDGPHAKLARKLSASEPAVP